MTAINRNIWSLDPYVYKATASGLEVYDLASESLLTFTFFAGGINSVWANSQHIYVATTNSGIYRSTASGTPSFSVYKEVPNITHNTVNYLHGAGDYLCATTESGVDRYTLSSASRETTTVSGPYKCFQTSVGDYYYVVNTTDPSTLLYAVYSGGGGHEYTSQDILEGFPTINDLYVTVGTSIYDSANVIFLATVSGAVVLEERRGNEANLRKRIYLIET